MDKKSSITVLVTGCTGMIGGYLVDELLAQGYTVIGIDKRNATIIHERYYHNIVDLADFAEVECIFENNQIDRVVHLAALAHKKGEPDLSYDRYHLINIVCSRNVFNTAAQRHIPILFISTADVYGFVKGVVNAETEPHPIGPYAITKYEAEKELKLICTEQNCAHTIFRFVPVYTDETKRDIQKRYYLKYPDWAYIIGKGMEYEFLHIRNAVQRIVEWVSQKPCNGIVNVKDKKMINTGDCLRQERAKGRAKHIFYVPRWAVVCGFTIIKAISGENRHSFLINKAVYPLRTE